MTPAYAFMDYKAQGQTMECVITDIAKPPTGSLSPFNAYVTLSCSCGRHTIRLLQDFEERLFTTHPSEELQKEDAQLAILEKKNHGAICCWGIQKLSKLECYTGKSNMQMFLLLPACQ
jgi:hypothetical protein